MALLLSWGAAAALVVRALIHPPSFFPSSPSFFFPFVVIAFFFLQSAARVGKMLQIQNAGDSQASLKLEDDVGVGRSIPLMQVRDCFCRRRRRRLLLFFVFKHSSFFLLSFFFFLSFSFFRLPWQCYTGPAAQAAQAHDDGVHEQPEAVGHHHAGPADLLPQPQRLHVKPPRQEHRPHGHDRQDAAQARQQGLRASQSKQTKTTKKE